MNPNANCLALGPVFGVIRARALSCARAIWIWRFMEILSAQAASIEMAISALTAARSFMPESNGRMRQTIADHSGKLIFPGAIDAQVHSRSQKGREGFEYSTRAAAAGGVTTIVDMPFDEGSLVCNADAVAEKAGDVAREAHVDVALYGTIHPKQGTGSIAEQVEAGVCAFKFSTFNTHPDRFPRIPPQLMSEAFAEIAKHGLAAGVHNENDEIVRARMAAVKAEGRTDYLAHGLTHTPLSELLAMAEIYEIGAYTGCPAHVVHCSLGRGIDICESYKRQGFAASVEVCIHYLCFAEDIDVKARGGTGQDQPSDPACRRAQETLGASGGRQHRLGFNRSRRVVSGSQERPEYACQFQRRTRPRGAGARADRRVPGSRHRPERRGAGAGGQPGAAFPADLQGRAERGRRC